ncbi:TetR/AcrR family transcriptional regulator [Actinocrispum sp. NPDC049592]|uniref:TetR/AcrR family transcriptional regulator n=1 Tax=Actinocrispum sp. NPDC049592 TaxID=3154835 RepID=UPI0034485564
MNAQATLPHRERLLREGTKLLYANGFHGTTVDKILAETGIPKGSFYHHFGSKEAFALAALERYMQFQHELLDQWANRDDLSTADAIVGYFQDMATRFVRSKYMRACLLGKLATETAAGSPVFRKALAGYIDDWKRRLVERLQQAGDIRTDISVEQIADSVLTLIQGVFVIALAARDQGALDSTAATLRLVVAGG